MGNSVNFKISSVAIKEEATENVYEAPTASTDYIPVKEGFSPEITTEELEREVLDGSREKRAPRKGITGATLPMPVELTTNETEGDAPQVLGLLMKSLLGQERQIATETTTDVGHTVNTIELQLGDGAKFAKGDCIVVKEANDFRYCAVESISGDQLTVFPSMDSAPSDSVVISKASTYYVGSTLPSLSAEVSYGQEQTDRLKGLKVASCSVGITAGALPTCDFSLSGNQGERVTGGAAFSGDYSAVSDPAVAKSACMYFKYESSDEEKMGYESFNLNLDNGLQDKLDACSSTGKGSPTVGQITITGDTNPYMYDQTEALALKRYNAKENDENVSIFVQLFNPSSVDGESEDHVMIYMPRARFTNIQAQNLNDNVVDAISFATAKGDSDNESFFISFV